MFGLKTANKVNSFKSHTMQVKGIASLLRSQTTKHSTQRFFAEFQHFKPLEELTGCARFKFFEPMLPSQTVLQIQDIAKVKPQLRPQLKKTKNLLVQPRVKELTDQDPLAEHTSPQTKQVFINTVQINVKLNINISLPPSPSTPRNNEIKKHLKQVRQTIKTLTAGLQHMESSDDENLESSVRGVTPCKPNQAPIVDNIRKYQSNSHSEVQTIQDKHEPLWKKLQALSKLK